MDTTGMFTSHDDYTTSEVVWISLTDTIIITYTSKCTFWFSILYDDQILQASCFVMILGV